MNVRLACQPSYAMAYCTLSLGESLLVERDAMAVMSAGMSVAAGIGSGGVAKAMMRKTFGGENFFMGRYTADVHNAWVGISPPYPGDIDVVDLSDMSGILVERGSFLAAGDKVDVDVKYAGLKSVVMREGITFLRMSGDGLGLICSYGGIQSYDLGPEQELIVDTGHLVAFSDTMDLRVGPLSSLTTAAITGEGFVASLSGPGRLWIQTRAEKSLQSWLFPEGAQDSGKK